MEISDADGPRLFLQNDLNAGLPAGKGVSVFKGHFHDQGMEFNNARTVHSCLVVAIMETRVGRGGVFMAMLPVTSKVISADT